MSDLAARSLRVALSGFVHDDDPTIIADMMAEIDRLRAENERLFVALATKGDTATLALSAAIRPMVRFDVGEKLLTIQWRKSRERGVLLLISGDGSAEYSVKRMAGEYYGMNGKDFALADGWPQEMLHEIAALSG